MHARTRLSLALPVRIAALSMAGLFALPPAGFADDDPGAAPAGQTASPAAAVSSTTSLSTFEGVLHIHPKFLYRYYIVGPAEGQHFALESGDEYGRDDRLKEIPVGSTIEVTGRLGTRFHAGGTAENLSPFPRCWYVTMHVENVKVIRGPDPLPKSDKNTPPPVTISPPPNDQSPK